MRCSTFCGLDEHVGAGGKELSQGTTQPTTWTSSALKTCPASLLGLTFKSPHVLASLHSLFFSSSLSLRVPCWCLPFLLSTDWFTFVPTYSSILSQVVLAGPGLPLQRHTGPTGGYGTLAQSSLNQNR